MHQASVTTTVPSTTPQMWYPAAGNQMNNEVDEPNQLGLRKSRNNAIKYKINATLCMFLLLIWKFLD